MDLKFLLENLLMYMSGEIWGDVSVQGKLCLLSALKRCKALHMHSKWKRNLFGTLETVLSSVSVLCHSFVWRGCCILHKGHPSFTADWCKIFAFELNFFNQCNILVGIANWIEHYSYYSNKYLSSYLPQFSIKSSCHFIPSVDLQWYQHCAIAITKLQGGGNMRIH